MERAANGAIKDSGASASATMSIPAPLLNTHRTPSQKYLRVYHTFAASSVDDLFKNNKPAVEVNWPRIVKNTPYSHDGNVVDVLLLDAILVCIRNTQLTVLYQGWCMKYLFDDLNLNLKSV